MQNRIKALFRSRGVTVAGKAMYSEAKRQECEAHAEELDANLSSLLDRLKTESYRAPPVRRVEIPKASGGTRALGIPTFEDKVLQRAVWCWGRSTSRTSWTVRTASGPVAVRTTAWKPCGRSS